MKAVAWIGGFVLCVTIGVNCGVVPAFIFGVVVANGIERFSN